MERYELSEFSAECIIGLTSAIKVNMEAILTDAQKKDKCFVKINMYLDKINYIIKASSGQ